jgi:hypothetical protein
VEEAGVITGLEIGGAAEDGAAAGGDGSTARVVARSTISVGMTLTVVTSVTRKFCGSGSAGEFALVGGARAVPSEEKNKKREEG